MYLLLFPNRESAVGACSGVLAGVWAISVMHPIESVKVRMQNGESAGAGATTRWQRLASLLRRPYYGILPHLVQYSALNSVRFGTFAAAKEFCLQRRAAAGDSSSLTIREIFLCGAFSGTCIAALLHPFFVLKTHQQVNRIGPSLAFKLLWGSEGWRGLFRGYVSGFVRFPVALGVFFSSYELLKRASTEVGSGSASGGEGLRWLGGAMGSGALAGVLCWTSIFPLDVVQSRIMGEGSYGIKREYTGMFVGFRRVFQESGLRGFTRGYSAVLLRSGPANAILLPANEMSKPLAEYLLPAA